MNTELPFVVEYAKSNRAACKTCKENIGKDTVRMGVMVQSPHFDGKVPMWHHLRCFFDKKKIKISSIADIANFDNLRWDDQNKIKEKIAQGPSTTKKGGEKSDNIDFSVEYAKSGRAGCRTCGEKILKGEIRISKLITDTPEAQRYGPMPGWRHVDCFVKDRLELEYSDSANKLPGFNKLEDDDKKMLLEKLKHLAVKREAEEPADEPTKKVAKRDSKKKADTSENGPSKKMATEERQMKAQNDLLFSMRDKLKANVSKKEMITLLEYNNQHVSVGEHNIRDNLSDCLVFGAIKTCPECKNATPRFKIDAYRCSGNVTEWTKCVYVTRCPEREPFKIPEEFKEKYDFLRDYKYVKRDRILLEKEEASNVTKGPLKGYIIAVFGKFNTPKSVIEKKVLELDGAINSKIDSSVQVCISTEKEINSKSKNVTKARNLDIHIVSPKFLEDVKNGSTPAISIKENLICSWGGDPILKFGIKKENPKNDVASNSSFSSSSTSKSTSKSSSKSSSKSTMKLTVQGGAAVDPQSGMEDKAHVYKKKDAIFSVVLGIVDVARGLNTFYKMQVLESNKMKKYWLFRSWGRIGTSIGNQKLESLKLGEAIAEFEKLYWEKTGNDWDSRKNFVKQPGRFYPLDIDYGEESKILQDLKPSDSCTLPKPVQELICLIFDIEAMKKAMVEFEIDLKKMPLGKLSKKQIEQAYSVLNEAQQTILTGSNNVKILDATNRFYTLIPHDFGLKTPPLLDNEELIKSKIEMLESLLEIELAYNLLNDESGANDPVTEHYEKLKTDIDVLAKSSEEYKIIDTYVKNTHADTHKMYDLVLNRVFKISRHGESERYKAFKKLHNKKLLWHGSRLTNYVGILSQGLRIAPPEAPVTGYMFGKGIYFADMVSKSANYCFTNKKNPTGLLLLCEVALGDMLERKTADYITKLPKGKHSTKGLGMTVPDPKETTVLDGVEVPYGKPVKSEDHSALLYNEYIVYDVNQVNIKYLLDVTFKWKY